MELDDRTLEPLLGAVRSVAREELLPRFDGPLAIETKDDGSLVTDADHAVDRRLRQLLGEWSPGAAVLSEEHPRAAQEAVLDALAATGDPQAVEMPRPMLHKGGDDFSFSGLKTAVRQTWEGTAPESRDDTLRADIAASAREAIVDVLVRKTLAAARRDGLTQVVIAGGVACNSRLRERFAHEAGAAGLTAFITPARHCSDNAAMVASLGLALDAEGLAFRGSERLGLDIHTTRRPQLGADRHTDVRT